MRTPVFTYGSYGVGLIVAAFLFGTAAVAKPAQTSAPQRVATNTRGAVPKVPPAPAVKAVKRPKAGGKKAPQPSATASVDWVPAEVVDEYFRD